MLICRPKGLKIMFFPCNQFGYMEPDSNESIKEWINTKYPVIYLNYPLFRTYWN